MKTQSITIYRAILEAATHAPNSVGDVDCPNDQSSLSFVTFKHGRTSIKLKNTAERLKEFAAQMLKSWALWGGGEKPAQEAKKAKSIWKATTVSLVAQLLEDHDYAGALELAERECGAVFYVGKKSTAFMSWAPQQVEGLPDGMVSARNDSGGWVVQCVKSGGRVGSAKKCNSRAAGESDARLFAEQRPGLIEKIEKYINEAVLTDTAAARAIWCEQRGISAQVEPVEIVPAVEPCADVEPVPALEPAPAVKKPTPVEPNAEPEVAAVAQDAPNFAHDIPASLAVAAHSGTSFSPDRRGDSVRKEYAEGMASDYLKLHAQATRGGTLALLPAVFARYRAQQSSALRAWLASSSRVVSSMIAGPSNFPAARMNKRAEISHRRLTEYIEGGQSAMRAAIRTLRPDLRPIMAGDADAIERLEAQLAQAERLQDMMKACNKAIRTYAKEGEAHQVAALIELGYTELRAIEILRPSQHWRGVGFQAYQLTNNNANIRRMRERLESLTAAKACEVIEIEGANGVRLEDDAPSNRVRLFFQCKPAQEIREDLKSSGFRWAPSLGAWQSYRNTRALETAQRIAGANLSEAHAVDPVEVEPVDPAEIISTAPTPAESQPGGTVTVDPVDTVSAGVGGVAHSNFESTPSPVDVDVLTLSVIDVQAMPQSTYEAAHDALESINYHTEALMLQCLRAGRLDLAFALANLVRWQQSPQYQGLGWAQVEARSVVSHLLRGLAVDTLSPEACIVLAEWGIKIQPDTPQRATTTSPAFVALMARLRSARGIAKAAIAKAQASSKGSTTPTPPTEPPATAAPYAYLVPVDGHRGGVAAAKNIRLVLKREFPGIKFSVKSDYNSARISWEDGPTAAAVDSALAPFDIGASDCQTDYFYTVGTQFSDTFGGVQYLFTNRSLSDALIGASLLAVFGPNGPTVDNYRKSNAWEQVPHGFFKGSQMCDSYHWRDMVRRHANGQD